MRLIDADALYKKIKARHDMFLDCVYIGDKARRDELGAFMADIVNAPTVEKLEPVEPDAILTYPVCGECHEPLDVTDEYCRHCGRAVKWRV